MAASNTAPGLPSIVWRMREGVAISALGTTGLEVSFRGSRVVLAELSAGMRQAIEQLVAGGSEESTLSDLIVTEGETSLAEWYCHLDLLQRLTAIEWIAADGDGVLAVMTGMTPAFRPALESLEPTARYRLSGFSFLRAVDGAWVAESPLSNARVSLSPRGVSILAELAVAGTPAELGSAASVSAETFERVAALLHSAGLLQEIDADGRCIADAEAEAQGWSFADALFHFRSRRGRFDGHFGARPDPAEAEAAPAAPYNAEQRIYLASPTPTSGPPDTFDAVLERRRSVRTYGPTPIGLGALSEFLYRAAGARNSDPARRTYPAGGSRYPLELYVVANRCEGLARGIHHYDPVAHALDRISAPSGAVDELVEQYQPAAATDPIQILLLITLRFGRISGRYENIAYALALKEVGALFQSMYLVATSLGLAPCAIGMGDSIAVAEALSIDPMEEAAIGEFLLGSAT